MEVENNRKKEDSDEYETYKEVITVNSMIPLWKRNKKDITEEEYNNFYSDKFFDYDEYERTHTKTTKSDADAIRKNIDLDNTDLRQVAMDVYPDHTKNGAQSQLRKVMNGERPMTDDVANKLNKMISRGNVAVN